VAERTVGGFKDWSLVFPDIKGSNLGRGNRDVSLPTVIESVGVLLGFAWLRAEKSRREGFRFECG
jgi:hypothetical protein